MRHLISIITPTFNCQEYIGECLESVKSQNLQDLVKHIVIDGVSDDATCDIVKSFENIELISEPDKGQSDAFNKGIIRADTPWIMILDGDDILLPGSLLRYINLIKKKSPDIVYGHQSFIDEKANVIKVNTSIKFKKRYALNGLFIPPSSGLCFKSSVIKNQLFNINHHYNMDTEWFLNHPSLRYGGYVIFVLIFFIPLSYLLSKYEISKNFSLKVVILFFLVTSIFVGRNIDRILYEQVFYKANFKQNMLFFTDKNHFRINNKLKNLSKVYNNCNSDIIECSNNQDFIIKKGYGKMILIRIKN